VSGFTFLEHTADVGIAATGERLEDALAWLAKGMFSLIVSLDTVVAHDCRVVSVSFRDPQTLVVDWLNELLYQYETEGFLSRDFQVSVDESSGILQAQCLGEAIDLERHRILTVVKAATYHQLEVTHQDQWYIKVVLDV
jgi:SHS2 domain-containing protein